MAIDRTLTLEHARQSIGDLFPRDTRETIWCGDSTVLVTGMKGFYNATFTLTEDSTPVQALREVRRCQKEFGFLTEEVENTWRNFDHAYNKAGIPAEISSYDEEVGIGSLFAEDIHSFKNDQQAIRETVLNAIEHGSDYCTKGPVTVRFLGGTKAALVEVTDAGEGSLKGHLSVDEIVQRQENAGKFLKEPPQNYRDLITPRRREDSSYAPTARGMGSIVQTLSKARINAEQTKKEYHVYLLYAHRFTDLPPWWQEYLQVNNCRYIINKMDGTKSSI